MNLETYQNLTGITVAEGDKARYNAVIRRTTAMLEAALGYSLVPSKNLDNQELGKVTFEGQLPYYPLNENSLLPADEQDGEYRLFPYNEHDIYLRIDPAANIYHVKLVQAVNDDEFITVTDLKSTTSKRTGSFTKHIEKQTGWFTWSWYGWLTRNVGLGNGLLVAVDADWLDCTNMPEDLQYLWADMVTYYSDTNISVTGNIKSESVNGHSWSRTNAGGGTSGDLSPEQSASGKSTIAQYAGPNGTLGARIPTV